MDIVNSNFVGKAAFNGGMEVVMTGRHLQIKPYPLGAHREADKLRFSFASRKENCGIILYDRKTGRRLKKIAFSEQEKMGNIYCKYLEDVDASAITYQYYEGDRIVPDTRARVFVGKHIYGKERDTKDLKAGFLSEDFDWEGDKRPHIPYEDSLCYCMHVRGFTRHPSSRVVHRGTFSGMIEKIPYLKETGITAVELQPAYEFLEIPSEEERRSVLPPGMVSEEDLDQFFPKKINYWGYKKSYYFAPKSAYAAGEDASQEFKEMIKAFHANGMEVVMQFYFPNDVEECEIPEILRFWVLEYHVDGFHLMGEHIPVNVIARDDALADTKLWYCCFDANVVYEKEEVPDYRNLASYQDDFMYVMRRYLKGDEDMLQSVLYQMRSIPEKMGRIHYLTNYYGMTLMDLVSYDHKHNEANGEENRDGSSYNCSWNCGEEGPTRRKKIQKLRKKQIKNAISMLLLSQSTPLIFMGDEFGNSQKGNNNPYCQDNSTAWLDWGDLERNQDIYGFWKELVKIRKEHPILHPARELKIMDTISCGYPDLSYHGQNAWRAQLESYNRHVGIMYCGKYARCADGQEDAFFYLAVNMHWESQKLALPRLPREMRWKFLLSTEESENTAGKEKNRKSAGNTDKARNENGAYRDEQSGVAENMVQPEGIFDANGITDSVPADTGCIIPARSITVFISEPVAARTNKKSGKRRTHRDSANHTDHSSRKTEGDNG